MITFEVWRDRDVALIEPVGALTLAAVPRLRLELARAAALTRLPLTAIVDGQTTRVDLAAIAILLIEHERLQGLGGALAVVYPWGNIAQLMRRNAVADCIPVFDTIEHALAGATSRFSPAGQLVHAPEYRPEGFGLGSSSSDAPLRTIRADHVSTCRSPARVPRISLRRGR